MRWETVKLANVAEIIRGVSFDNSETVDYAAKDTLPILRAGNIQEEVNTLNDLVWVPKQRVTREQLLKKGDILIAMSSGSIAIVGKTAQMEDDWNGSVGAFCAIVRPKENILHRFLHFCLRGPQFSSWRQFTGIGLNIKNIRRSELESFPIPLPPLSEQRRIVEILDQADALRKMRREADAIAERILPALFYKMFGDPVRNEKGWKTKRVGDLVKLGPQYGANASSIDWEPGLPRYIRITDITEDGALRDDEIRSLDSNNWDEYLLEEDDIVIARSGATVGKVYLHEQYPVPCVFAGYLIRFRFDKSRLHPWFFFAFTRTVSYVSWVEAKKRTAAQPNINGQEYASLLVPVPPIELQDLFVQKAKKISAIKKEFNMCSETAETMFQTLLHRAFTGELTKGWEEESTI
jgi:type I restriction enzyme S subunit